MKRYFFLCGCLAGLLALSACSDEVMETTDTPEKGKNSCAITISLPVKQSRNLSKSYQEETYGGEWNVEDNSVRADKGVILIFESKERDLENGAVYTLSEWQDITFAKETHSNLTPSERWTARSSFTPEKDKYYRFYAFAYNSESGNFTVKEADDDGHNLQTELALENRQLQNTEETLSADKVVSFTLQHTSTQSAEGYPIELFGGFLGAYSGGLYPEVQSPTESMIVSGTNAVDNSYSFGGELRRLTGRLEVTLTDIPEDEGITSMALIMEKYTQTIPVGWEEENKYYMPFEPKEMVTVAAADVQDGTAILNGNMFHNTMPSYMYVEVRKTDGTMRYPVKVADKYMALGPDAAEGWVVKDNKITIITNYWFQLNGTYEQLTKGNLKMKISWDEDYIPDDIQLTEE